MSTEEELKDVEFAINAYAEALSIKNQEEAALNEKISALRSEIATIRDNKYQITQKIRTKSKDKESLTRKRNLEIEAEIIQKTLEEKREKALELIKDAPWFNTAFGWQIDGALMLPDRGLLGDKRGLGKTLSSIIWLRIQEAKKTLICLRKEVASDFIKELSIREPDLVVISLLGATSETRNMYAMLLKEQTNFAVVTNIESWRRNVDKTTEDILKIDYDTVILDEAHHIKTPETGTAQGFFRIADKIPKVLLLTGTPIKNRPQEMFSLLYSLYPDQFPAKNKFLFDYCVSMGQNKWAFSPSGLKSLVAKISHFYIARTPEDIGRKVPPPHIIEYKLDFESHLEQKKAYKDMTERNMAILTTGKVVPIMSQLAIMTRQAQVVSWPAGITFEIKDEGGEVIEVVKFDVHQSVKADWAMDLISELVEEGERVVLFSRFKPAIYELKRRLELAGLRVAVITGDEKAKGNTERVFNDFDLKTADPDNYEFDVLLATYQTVGESANLNAAGHMVLYDRFWNPGNEDQAIGRIDRINSVTQATIHVPEVANSIDEYMADLIDEKRTIVAHFKDESEQAASLKKHLEESL